MVNIDAVNFTKNIDNVNMMRMAEKNKTYHHGNLRATLLSAAVDLLDEKGVEGVTIRGVARMAGVAHSAPANHFATRQALLSEIAANIFLDLGRELEAIVQRSPRKSDDVLRAFASHIVEFGLLYPERYKLVWRWDLLSDSAEMEAVMDRVYDRLLMVLDDRTGVQSLSSHSDAIAFWSLLHGYVSLRLDGVFVEKHDEISGAPRSEAIIDVILNGMKR